MDLESVIDLNLYTKIITAIHNVNVELEESVEWLICQVFNDLGQPEWQGKEDVYIEEVIKKGKIGWKHECFTVFERVQNEQDAYVLNPFEVEEGVVQCPRCKNYKVFSVAVQTRAADEPTTTMAQCTICKYKWSQNG